jgi:two-component system response regulator YesN
MMINILLVEDELLIRSGMKSLVNWSAHGFYLAAEAAHGQEALEILEKQKIDIVITDIRMPVMDGLELIEKIKERDYKCQIIILSSYDDFKYVKAAMKLGVKDYIHKPTMTPKELIDSLIKAAEDLNKHQSIQEYEKMIMETIEESQILILEKVVRLSLYGKDIEQKSKEMLKNVYFIEEAFYLGLLRFVHDKSLEQNLPSEHVQEQRIGSCVEKMNMKQTHPIYYVKEGENWLFFLPPDEMLLLQKLQEELNKTDTGTITVLVDSPCTFNQLQKVYIELFERLNMECKEWEKMNQFHTLISEALKLIHDNYMENLTLEKVSATIHVSPAYFSRLFQKETGITFIDYLTKYRINKAQYLLLHTDMRTYEIAEKVGYKNSKYFLKVFKKWVGTTPGEFRSR